LEGARGNAVRREGRSRPWEEPDPPSSSAPASTTSTSSPAVVFVFLPSDEPRHLTPPTLALRPVATKVRTSTPLPFVDAPAFEPRGKRVARTAPPR
jgi:hypothetical protein